MSSTECRHRLTHGIVPKVVAAAAHVSGSLASLYSPPLLAHALRMRNLDGITWDIY